MELTESTTTENQVLKSAEPAAWLEAAVARLRQRTHGVRGVEAAANALRAAPLVWLALLGAQAIAPTPWRLVMAVAAVAVPYGMAYGHRRLRRWSREALNEMALDELTRSGQPSEIDTARLIAHGLHGAPRTDCASLRLLLRSALVRVQPGAPVEAPDVEMLAGLLEERDPNLAIAALDALARLRLTDAEPAARRILDEPWRACGAVERLLRGCAGMAGPAMSEVTAAARRCFSALVAARAGEGSEGALRSLRDEADVMLERDRRWRERYSEPAWALFCIAGIVAGGTLGLSGWGCLSLLYATTLVSATVASVGDDVVARIAAADDPRFVPFLLEVYPQCSRVSRNLIDASLAGLLERVRAEDEDAVSEAAAKQLCTLLNTRELAIPALHAIAELHPAGALAQVESMADRLPRILTDEEHRRRLAQGSRATGGYLGDLLAARRECLARLKAHQARQQERATLVRPSGPEGEALLRPAASASTPEELLLRPGGSEVGALESHTKPRNHEDTKTRRRTEQLQRIVAPRTLSVQTDNRLINSPFDVVC